MRLFAEIGMRVEGALLCRFDTGFGETVWALQTDGNPSFDGLFVIDEGDYLA